MEKTNIQFIEDIVEELKNPCGEGFKNEKLEELSEFLAEISDEITDNKDKISKLEKDLSDQRSTIADLEDKQDSYSNTEVIGPDTIHWKLENGNMVISQEIEAFVEAQKKSME